jgi:hypothetical protein
MHEDVLLSTNCHRVDGVALYRGEGVHVNDMFFARENDSGTFLERSGKFSEVSSFGSIADTSIREKYAYGRKVSH